ncbi:unnamed protein product [Soboliphyme baturini]|uniref:Peptidase S1 domain-containing protein n=1 Tax=Soboliphyme baturini TaxID=241478 RepID=A0A183ITM6_9BILA|nr:unnamed protein product [Soboliphyme baturini]
MPQGRAQPGQYCYAVGLGQVMEDVDTDVPRYAEVQVVSNSRCKHSPEYVEDIMLCVEAKSGHSYPYKGDSGSPLVCPEIRDGITVKVLYGLLSRITRDGTDMFFYMDIHAFQKWIKCSV